MGGAAPLRPAAGDGLAMISLEDLLRRHTALDRREVVAWVENRWVLPERRDKTWIFHDVDVARVELILEIRREFANFEDQLDRSEEHTSELQSHSDLVCRLLLEKKKAKSVGLLDLYRAK